MNKYFSRTIVAVIFVVSISFFGVSVVQAKPSVSAQKQTEVSIFNQISNLNSQIISTNDNRLRVTNSKDKIEKNKVLDQIIKQRKILMKDLMKTNPSLFNTLAIKSKDRLSLDNSLQKDVEQVITITGKTEVIHIDDFKNKENSRFDYSIKTSNGKKYAFYPSSGITLTSGADVKVTGYALDNQITASVNDDEIVKISEATLDSVGDQKTLAILVKSSPGDSEPFTPAQGKELIFNGQFQKFMQEQSYGQVSFSGDVVGWFSTNQLNSGCIFLNPTQLIAVANNYGIDFSNYGRIVYLVKDGGGGCSGLGKGTLTINGQDYNLSQTSLGLNEYNSPSGWGNQPFIWTNLDYLLAHEFGHALGVMHANGWDCGDASLYGDCQHLEYGNYFDTMGGYSNSMDFNLLFKEILGWVPPSRILSINQSGTYTINTLKQMAGIVGAKININTPTGLATPYYLEFRKGIGFDSNLNNSKLLKNKGLFVNAINTDYFHLTPRLLDARATTADWFNDLQDQVTLNSGEIFTDPNQGITINSVNQTSTSTLSFNVNISTVPCVYHIPAVSISSDNEDGVSASGSLFSNIQVINNDSISCGPSVLKVNYTIPAGWTIQQEESLDPVFPNKGINNYASIYPNNALPGTYNIGLEVVNMKSGLKNIKQIPIIVTPTFTINNITPSFGLPGTSVVITGTGFSDWNNTVSLSGPLGWVNTRYINSSNSGIQISYVIPSMVETCNENGCYSTSTPHGLYILNVHARGASANVDFYVSSSTQVEPTVVLNNNELKLAYDSSQRESSLKSTFNFSINSGNKNTYVHKYGALITFTDQNGEKNQDDVMIEPISSVDTATDAYGNTLYIIPANTVINFQAVRIMNPKQMFAGSYTASLNSIYVYSAPNAGDKTGLTLTAPPNETNSVLIIGELSPYINSVSTSPTSGGVLATIEGVRLQNSKIVKIFDSTAVITNITNSVDGTTMQFIVKAPAGVYQIQVGDTITGFSNILNFEMPATPFINLVLPNKDDTFYKGESATIKWNTENVGTNYITIVLLKPTGAIQMLILGGGKVKASVGEYVWKVPTVANLVAGAYKIKIMVNNLSGVFSQVDNIIISEPIQPLTVSCSPSDSPVLVNSLVKWTAVVDTGGNGVHSYVWTGMDGLAGNIQTVSKAYNTVGTKNATVTVTSDNQTTSANCSVNVINQEGTSITILSPNGGETFEIRDNITITWKTDFYAEMIDSLQLVSVSGATYNLVTDMSNDGSTNAPIPINVLSGQHKIKIKATAFGQAYSDTSDAYFEIVDEPTIPPPVITPIPFSASCKSSTLVANVGQQVHWSADVIGGSGNYYYSWVGSDGLTAKSVPGVTKVYSNVGIKKAMVTVTDLSNSQAVRDTCEIEVKKFPPISGVDTNQNYATASMGWDNFLKLLQVLR